MSSRRQSYLSFAAGAAISSAAWLIRQGRVNRQCLYEQSDVIAEQAIERLELPLEAHWIEANGVRLHTVLAGPQDGPLIVLLHGFPEIWFTWRKQIKPLAEAGYRVVVPDQRGYNLSDKPAGVASYRIDVLATDIRALIYALGAERAIIAGHDWGGSVAWALPMLYPEVVDRLIVMNAPHPAAFARELRDNPDQRRRSWYIAFFQLPWLPELLIGYSPRASAEFFFRKGATRFEAFTDDELDMMATGLAQPGALTAMLNWYRAIRLARRTGEPRPIEHRTLLIWGQDDKALGPSLTCGLEPWAPNLALRAIPNCGHWVQNEAPGEVNAHMLAFLKSE